MTFQSDGYVAMAEVSVHHVGYGSIVLALTIYHHAEQLAASLVFIAIEHLHGEQVIGGGANVRIEYHQRYAGIFFMMLRLNGVVIIILRTRCEYSGIEDEDARQHPWHGSFHSFQIDTLLMI